MLPSFQKYFNTIVKIGPSIINEDLRFEAFENYAQIFFILYRNYEIEITFQYNFVSHNETHSYPS